MRGPARALLCVGLAAAAPLAGQPPAGTAARVPPWTSFEGFTVGAPIDDALAGGARCVPTLRPEEGSRWNPLQIAHLVFGRALPHPVHDTSAMRRALEPTTTCSFLMMDGRAMLLALALERRVAAMTVWLRWGREGVPRDSLLGVLRERWGKGTGNDLLEMWWGDRYRAFLTEHNLILLDAGACSRFERQVHAGRRGGDPVAC